MKNLLQNLVQAFERYLFDQKMKALYPRPQAKDRKDPNIIYSIKL